MAGFRRCWFGSLAIGLVVVLPGCAVEERALDNSTGEVFRFRGDLDSRWISFENPTGAPGTGGIENNGAKGHPSELLKAGETKVLVDVKGAGIINRIWMTISDRSKAALRGLVLKAYWDNQQSPAVSVPLGDFFGVGLGRTASFENALFASPEGRSFVSLVQMPFRESARIEVVNELSADVSMLFFDVNYQLRERWPEDVLYFHAYWHRDMATTLAEDFEILPRVEGRGRFLGANVGVVANPAYGDSWWGEGEVKIYLNGDNALPTLVGTGTEDYIGTGWGQGRFFNRYSGCSVADSEKGEYSFYRFHLPDPVFFKTDCRVTLQQMGGTQKSGVLELLKRGVPLLPVTIGGPDSSLVPLYRKGELADLNDPSLPGPEAWTNFYRSDDVSAVAYFYLDRPSNGLPPIQDRATRTSDAQ